MSLVVVFYVTAITGACKSMAPQSLGVKIYYSSAIVSKAGQSQI